MRASLLFAALLAGAAACRDSTGLDTGLKGVALRGPVQPVCLEGVPCDAPFAATFWVLRGSSVATSFESDADGHFEVRLAPGTYVIAPDDRAPVMRGQSQEVVVGTVGLTSVELEFDTGIR